MTDRKLSRIWPLAGATAFTVVMLVLMVISGAYFYLSPSLPSAETLRDVELQTPLRIYSRDGRLMAQIGEKRRTPASYVEIPEIVVNAFLAAEDDRFFEHPGFDYQGITRAAINLALTGSRSQGGSTITQQLARVYFLTRERSFIRKAKELILAVQIESEFSKQEILALYLNKIFLGQRSYGVGAAAEVYFGKSLDELNTAEAATIAGMPKAPSSLNPVRSIERATERRAYVLRRMFELDFIDRDEYDEALALPMESHLYGPKVEMNAPYVTEMVRAEMVARYGLSVYTDGYKVVTTINSKLQNAANDSLRAALLEYDRRHGYRGPIDRATLDSPSDVADPNDESGPDVAGITQSPVAEERQDEDTALAELLSRYPRLQDLHNAVVLANREDNSATLYIQNIGQVTVPWDNMRWRPYVNDDIIGGAPDSIDDIVAVGDIISLLHTADDGWQLAQIPQVQGAFVALDPHDGATVALIGGFDFFVSKFNRAVQTKRQPGSSFKPFIYSAALENGFTTATLINDAPVVFDDAELETAWRPENYSRKFHGPTRLREALIKSLNLVSVRILRGTGLGPAIRHIEPFGLPTSALPRDLSLALGSGGASPREVAAGYAAFASGGFRTEPYLIDRVLNSDDHIVFQAQPGYACRDCEPAVASDTIDLIDTTPESPPTDPDERVVETPVAGFPVVREPDVMAEIPRYPTVDAMIQHGLTWRPAHDDTPVFFDVTGSPPERVISPENAYLIYDMMRDVIQRGTGRRARELGRPDLAGKTGTSNDRRDAWFSGFNGDLVATAWVGFDQGRPLGAGEEGSRTALPIWKYFMRDALADTQDATIPRPSGIITARIVPETGLVAPAGYSGAIFELFREGHVPDQQLNDSGSSLDFAGIGNGSDDEDIF